MRKIINIVFLWCFFAPSQSQGQGLAGIELNAGTGLMYYTGKDERAAKTSYNETYAGQLANEMGNTGIPFMYELGARFWLTDNFGLTLNYSFARHSLSAEFNNGNQRHFTIKDKTPLDAGLVFGKMGKYAIQARIGFCTSTLLSSYEYPDGTVNYSQLQPINGTYTDFGFFYRLDYSRQLKGPIRIFAGIGGATDMGNYYSDLSGVRELDGASAAWVPTDFGAYEQVLPNGNFYDYPDDKYWGLGYFMFYGGLQLNISVYEQ
jgi:hypothetical protein